MSFIVAYAFFVSTTVAGTLQYRANLKDAMWSLSQNSPLQCTLSHYIPRYGVANFSSKANKKLNMSFELDMLLLPDNYSLATIRSEPPQWRPGESGRKLGNMKLYKQFNAGLSKEMAWTMLGELEQGMTPTFYYNHWYNEQNSISVGISSAKFKRAYSDFVFCVSNLLNYSFDDIAFTVLNYQSDSDELTAASKARFEKLKRFIALDHGVDVVLVDAYSDSYGGRSKNLALSKSRANKIKDTFVKSGIEATIIEAKGHGEKKHIATNANTLGRGENRRVVIKMEDAF
ncbi:MAG: flagellar protein MotY [Colwellia sp.]